ncbi:MAG: class I SAM-dependent methyltransferase [Candidatus Riflebacteria bacterium]|nr:class I SAM-dependent methyltransferase [Candidatus Riflebacteria bacterium]
MKQPNYAAYARFYDYFELAGCSESEELNIFLDEFFELNGVKTVLDFACGTGAQAVGLARSGYQVTAADLSAEMLKLARDKATDLPVTFVKADMRTAKLGSHDAAICIFNAIGHLTREECRAFFAHARGHLNPQGIFVTDIFNYKAMTGKAFAQYRRMRREAIIDGLLVQHVRNCTLLKDSRQLRIESLTRAQDGTHKPEEIKDDWQMQLYESEELYDMLKSAGFSEINFFGSVGCDFDSETTESILAVCQK